MTLPPCSTIFKVNIPGKGTSQVVPLALFEIINVVAVYHSRPDMFGQFVRDRTFAGTTSPIIATITGFSVSRF